MRTELNNGLVEPKLLSDSLDKCMMCAFHCRTCSTVLPSVTIFSPAHSRCFTLRRGRPKGGCEQRLPPHPRPSEAARPSAASRGRAREMSSHSASPSTESSNVPGPSSSRTHQSTSLPSPNLALYKTVSQHKSQTQSTPQNISEARLEKCLGCRAPTSSSMRYGVMRSPR